ncbi:hypothetical protein [Desulfonatronovibrio magnus]|uniref:hypothetical protein n=1 Tax=Desulfonatronovibrio magnus TaxID=698827 RepID=UPI0005EBEB7D|nr:hypothetical protein [Desulfonatronovibrio magnus]
MTIWEKIDKVLKIKGLSPLPDCGLLLVGSNPLPVYTLIKSLQPRMVLLLGTEEVKYYLYKLVEISRSEGIQDVEHAICEPVDSLDISVKIKGLLQYAPQKKAWFSYTAGTKSMSVNGFEAWKSIVGNNEHWATYLSPYGQKIHLNKVEHSFPLVPGSDYEVPEIGFKEIVKLHLNTFTNNDECCKNDHENDKLITLSRKIHGFLCGNPTNNVKDYLQLLPRSYIDKLKLTLPSSEDKNGKSEDFEVSGIINFLIKTNFKTGSPSVRHSFKDWGMNLNVDGAEHLGILDDVVKKYFCEDFESNNKSVQVNERIKAMKWLVGKWLEVWVADSLKSSKLFSEVHDSCELQPPGAKKNSNRFEVDVCAMRGVTPFIFSCTVDSKENGINKGKLFEVGQRSRQLGGEHARSALVCLSDSSSEISDIINEGWKGYNTVKVFGKDDICDQETFIDKVNDWIDLLEQ